MKKSSLLFLFLAHILTVHFAFSQTAPSICLVTADDSDAEDFIIYWNSFNDFNGNAPDSIYIYRREIGEPNFVLVDVVENETANSYTDDEVSTGVIQQYAIKVKYPDGTLSPISKYHQPAVMSYTPNYPVATATTSGLKISHYIVEDLNETGNYEDFLSSARGMKVDMTGATTVEVGVPMMSWGGTALNGNLGFDLSSGAPNDPFQSYFEFDSIIGQCPALTKSNINTSRTNIKKKPSIFADQPTYAPALCLVGSSHNNIGKNVVYWGMIPPGNSTANTVDSVLIYRKKSGETTFLNIASVSGAGGNYYIDPTSSDSVYTKYKIAFKFQDGNIGEPSVYHQSAVLTYHSTLPVPSSSSDGVTMTNYLVEGTLNSADFVGNYEAFQKDNTMSAFSSFQQWADTWSDNYFETNTYNDSTEFYMNITMDSIIGQCQGDYYRAIVNTSKTNTVKKIPTKPGTSSLEELSLGIKISPNPVDNYLFISLEESSVFGKITIIDVSGKTRLTKEINNLTETINVSGLELGMYFVHFENKNQETSTWKIVKK